MNGLATNDAPGAAGSVIGGQLTLVGTAAESLGIKAFKLVPALGNLFSAGLAVRDFVSGYKACVAGQ